MAGVNYCFAPSSIQIIDGLLTFFESPLRQFSIPHCDAVVLTLEVRKHLMKQILVDSSNVADLLYLHALLCLGYKSNSLHNPKRILVGFNGSQTNSIGEIVLLVLVRPATVLVPLKVIDEPSFFNTILGRTLIHAMKALPSLYH